jgi:carbon-monoxide dehydrogenase small subunit
MAEMDIRMTVNGSEQQVKAEAGRTLLSILRSEAGLTGTKDGCSSGDCGACVVILDGKVVNSCMVLAPQAEGSEITTVEGLAVMGQLHPLQHAFADTWAFQCGFCTQGMLISCHALLLSNQNPSREEILTAISGNLCRCTAYQAVVKAVQQAAAEMRSGDENQHD